MLVPNGVLYSGVPLYINEIPLFNSLGKELMHYFFFMV